MSTRRDYSDLRRRLLALLTTWPELTHTASFAAGALFALERAEKGGLRERASYGEADRAGHAEAVRRLFAALDVGQEPSARWLAGFMYNSAIMRLDACYERFLEAIAAAMTLPDPPRTAERLSDTERRARQIESSLQLTTPWVRTHLEANRKDVNQLKHELFGREAVHAQARATGDVENTLTAFAELLTIMETPAVVSRLRGAYQDLPPA